MMGGQGGPHWNKDDVVIRVGDDVVIVISNQDVTVWVLNQDGTYQMASCRRGQ